MTRVDSMTGVDSIPHSLWYFPSPQPPFKDKQQRRTGIWVTCTHKDVHVRQRRQRQNIKHKTRTEIMAFLDIIDIKYMTTELFGNTRSPWQGSNFTGSK